ncbi:MAG: GNAT family N-acetyltransferase [Pseudomonadota bacterium]
MNIRPATLDDARRIAEIHRTARAQAMPWLPVRHSAEEDFEFFRNQVIAEQTVFVAHTETAQDLAGFVAFGDGWLNHLYVSPNAFRIGVGSELLRLAQDSSPVLRLWTFQRNQIARNFYAKRGFSEVEWTNGDANEEKTADVKMVWRKS